MIDAPGLAPDQVIEQIIADAEHWHVDWPDEKVGIYGVKAMLTANKVLTGMAVRGDLEDIANTAAYYVSIAKKYKKQVDELATMVKGK